MKVPKPGERMRSHPLYRVKTKPPVVFDDQRPGWDSTSRDLDKYKLTDEQVDVSATIHPRAANPNVSAPTSTVERFQIQPPTHTQSDHHPIETPHRRRVANNSSARTSPRPGKSSARVRTPPRSWSTRGTHRASPRSIPPNHSAASSTKPTAATDRERTNHHHRPRSGGVTWPREEAAWAPCASPR